MHVHGGNLCFRCFQQALAVVILGQEAEAVLAIAVHVHNGKAIGFAVNRPVDSNAVSGEQAKTKEAVVVDFEHPHLGLSQAHD